MYGTNTNSIFIKKRKYLFSRLLLIGLLFQAFASLGLTPNTQAATIDTKPFYYVALGDSITEGTGMESNQDTFVYQFGQKLKETHENVFTTNQGHAGDTTSEIESRLHNDEATKELEKANIITITAGGNDLLQAALQIATKATGEPQKKPSKIPSLIKKETVAKSMSSYLDTPQMQKEIDSFLANFSEHYNTLLSTVRSKNKDAIILVQTIYNPASGSQYQTLSACVEQVMKRMNAIIVDTASEFPNVSVIDVHSAFENKGPEYTRINQDDIHPSQKGHSYIAELLYQRLVDLEQETYFQKNNETASDKGTSQVLSNQASARNSDEPTITSSNDEVNDAASNQEEGRTKLLTYASTAFLSGLICFALFRLFKREQK